MPSYDEEQSMTSAREHRSSSLAHQIITEVASREGVEPLDLEIPLYDAVDPEALEALFTRPRDLSTESTVTLSFTYYDYEIVVESDRSVSVSDRAGALERSANVGTH